MRLLRAKQVKKTLKFFQLTYGIRGPYQVTRSRTPTSLDYPRSPLLVAIDSRSCSTAIFWR
jgi:hypothetical protein